ncbi:MAG: RNA-binding protein [Candidatus Aenigmarchaeota archaeon]|nr:RNA-binding protein [Candidatus Aenigmarchaeota archaeon]
MTENSVVVPGELLGDRKGRKLGQGLYLDGENVFSKFVGVPRINDVEMSVVPLAGVYLPYFGDRVIGVIESVEVSGWVVDINCPYSAFLPLSEGVEGFVDTQRTDLTKFFDIDDVIMCVISRVTKNKTVQVSMDDQTARKLVGGVALKVTPSKIPRIIGKAGSMIMMIKEKTKCDIVTGQNGLVWIRGENKAKAIEAIVMIEKESHLSGLTEKIEKMLGE